MSPQAGYSGTPLPKKLGLLDGQAVAFIGLPDQQNDLPKSRAFRSVEVVDNWTAVKRTQLDFIHLFTDDAATVDASMDDLRDRIVPAGMIWMSWPKKASKVPTDVTEDVIRNRALEGILVDVKVCAVDEIWSGLKLVIRKEHRAEQEKYLEQKGRET